MTVQFYEQVEDHFLKYSVIVAQYKGQWVFCKHRQRDTLECPGGKRETQESIAACAHRELQEETGATRFEIEKIGVYGVRKKESEIESYGMLYYATIFEFADLESEIESIHFLTQLPTNWTYPAIQPLLVERVMIHLLLQSFYKYLSFSSISNNQLHLFSTLFSEDATIQENNQVISIQDYIQHFKQVMQDYPAVFQYGFLEKQLTYTYQKESHAIVVHSTYQKEYNKNVEYGTNHIQIKKIAQAYKITNVSYEETS